MIKTWQQRCEEHPDHEGTIITYQMIQARMQEEIDDLREALEEVEELREALKTALAESEKLSKPVAWMHTNGVGHVYFRKKPQDKVFNPRPVYLKDE